MTASQWGDIVDPENPPENIRAQEHVSSQPSSTKQHEKHHVRHRASIACASCRDKRIRCVVPKGKFDCNQCRKLGMECIIRMNDERRRPISKAYVASLCEHIKMLEGMLLANGLIPPKACHPPKTRQEASESSGEDDRFVHPMVKEEQDLDKPSIGIELLSPPDSMGEDLRTVSEEENGISIEMLSPQSSAKPLVVDLSSWFSDSGPMNSPGADYPESVSKKRRRLMTRRKTSEHMDVQNPLEGQQDTQTNFQNCIPVPFDLHTTNLDLFVHDISPSGPCNMDSSGWFSVKEPYDIQEQSFSNHVFSSAALGMHPGAQCERKNHLFLGHHTTSASLDRTRRTGFGANVTSSGTTHGEVPNSIYELASKYNGNTGKLWKTRSNNATAADSISLEKLLQSVEQAAGGKPIKSVTPRRQDLDYFSF